MFQTFRVGVCLKDGVHAVSVDRSQPVDVLLGEERPLLATLEQEHPKVRGKGIHVQRAVNLNDQANL